MTHVAAPEVQCHGKQSYPSKKEARRGLRRMRSLPAERRRFDEGDVKLTVYRCPHCGRWHVGHATFLARREQERRRDG